MQMDFVWIVSLFVDIDWDNVQVGRNSPPFRSESSFVFSIRTLSERRIRTSVISNHSIRFCKILVQAEDMATPGIVEDQ